MILHGYWRSSAAWRVRIALNLKGIPWTHQGVSLVRGNGEQHGPEFAAINPQKLVPALQTDRATLTQSLAIVEYLEEVRPAPALLPTGAAARARVRAIAMAVACDIHPVNNLRVIRYLAGELGIEPAQRARWYAHWVTEGLQAIETMLATSADTGEFCHRDAPTLADVCLVPQLYNARRFDVDLTPYPCLVGIESRCLTIPAFADAAPENQPDAT